MRLTNEEGAEYARLADKVALHTYIGFNLCRTWFMERADADRFLELVIKRDPDSATHYSYGAPCVSRVEPSKYDGKDCFEVVYG